MQHKVKKAEGCRTIANILLYLNWVENAVMERKVKGKNIQTSKCLNLQ
jgi:hypothetical protein